MLKKLLGGILQEMGFITEDQLSSALFKQKEIMQKNALPERMERVTLVSNARVDKEREPGPLLGRILTEMGLVTETQLQNALKEQNKAFEVYESLKSSRLGTLLEIGSLINSSLNLAEVLTIIMRNVNRFIGSAASTLMLLDEETGELVFSVPTGPHADDLTDIRLPPGEGIAGWVAQHEEPLLIPDVAQDSRFYPKIDEISGLVTKSVLCVPLKAKAKLIGVLEAINKSDGSMFTSEDELFLSLFASQAAMAIENARLYSEMKTQLAEIKKMQKMIAKSEKFEALGQMASGVAHDFNNILVAIMGYSELALHEMPEDRPERKFVDQILKASDRAKELVKQILAFSRQSGQEKRPVMLHLVVQEALKLMRASLPSTIEIRQNIRRNPGLDTIMADPTQIHQILMNLCTNAHHAMNDKGGVLEIRMVPIEIGAGPPMQDLDLPGGPYVRLSVSDTGQGMSKKTTKRIFEPYFTTKKKGVGTGMGLAVVHGIVESHGGAITVDSKPGKGSTFDVYLPLVDQQGEEDTEVLEPLPLGHERILFVDDEDAIAELGKEMLERLGYQVYTRTSSVEALEAFRAQPRRFDIIVTDKTMPNMTGFALAKEIKTIRPDIPVILCTGFSESDESRKAKVAGIQEMVMKPLVMSDLARTVRHVLDRSKKGLGDART